MRALSVAIGLPLSFVFAGLLPAQGGLEQLPVSAAMDIWRAGGYDDGSDGVAPAQYVFQAGAGRILAFSAVTGSWSCRTENDLFNGPDGSPDTCPIVSIEPIGSFSGYNATDFSGAMVGMFLEDTLPVSALRTLSFYVSDNSDGGIQTDFRILDPLIGQVFFIGDGLTETGTGSVQGFLVPPTATHLYLGYVDSCNPGTASVPSCYFDNGGTVTAVFKLYTVR